MSGMPVVLGRRTRVPSREEILRQLRHKPGSTAFALARALQKPLPAVAALLQELLAAREVTLVGACYFGGAAGAVDAD